jgi:hypothetical protein
MTRRPPTTSQLELDWQAPQPVTKFEERVVRAASVSGRMCRAMAAALHDTAQAGRPRKEIAQAMSDYLHETVSVPMLDAYVSEARETHTINLPRFVALVHATQDRRLLETVAEMFGWSVVPAKFVPLIKLAALREQEDALKRERMALIHNAKREGAL